MWNEFKQRMNYQATLKGLLLGRLVSLRLFFLRDTFYLHLGMANLTPNPTTPCYNPALELDRKCLVLQQEWASRPKRLKILKTLRQQSLKEARLPLISGRMCERELCMCGHVHTQSLSRVRLFVTTWTLALYVPLSMGFPRQEYWCGLPFLPPGDLSHSRIKLSPASAGRL